MPSRATADKQQAVLWALRELRADPNITMVQWAFCDQVLRGFESMMPMWLPLEANKGKLTIVPGHMGSKKASAE